MGVCLYNAIQRHVPWMHHVYFNYLEQAAMHVDADRIIGKERFEKVLDESRPDIVLSTHAHLNHGFFTLARRTLGRARVKCITYCGELYGGYGFSRFWVNPAADLFIGAVNETCQAAASLGMSAQRNWMGGFMLKPAFYGDGDQKQERARLPDIDESRFLLVLATGSNSANNHLSLLNALERARLPVTAAVLCGRDENTSTRVKDWAAGSHYINVEALPYLADTSALLSRADAVVTRPGTGTTSEAILCGGPIIFNGIGGIMPQEGITVKYARSHGLKHVISSAGDLPKHVAALMDDGELKNRRLKMKNLCPSRSPADIIQKVIA